MTPELWQRLKPLFHAALERSTQDRSAFIDAACGDDLELKMHLKQLVDAEEQASGSLDAQLAHLKNFLNDGGVLFQPSELVPGRLLNVSPMIGRTISHYRIIERLGGGAPRTG